MNHKYVQTKLGLFRTHEQMANVWFACIIADKQRKYCVT